MPASRHHALVRNIVNQLADLYSERIPSDEWVAVRQATNDEADAFVAKLLAAHDAETVRVTAEKAIRAVEENAGEADESGICEGVSGWRNKERASAYSLGALEAVDSIREEFGLAPDEKGGA